MKIIKNKIVTAALVALTFTITAHASNAGTLENMERERALMIETILSGDIKNGVRQQKVEIANARLIDLERMVLRDKTLNGRSTRAVHAAFKNYDLTFLIHAATEKNRSVADHWLGEIGLTTSALMNARMGRR
jgi:hypothetical protein